MNGAEHTAEPPDKVLILGSGSLSIRCFYLPFFIPPCDNSTAPEEEK